MENGYWEFSSFLRETQTKLKKVPSLKDLQAGAERKHVKSLSCLFEFAPSLCGSLFLYVWCFHEIQGW